MERTRGLSGKAAWLWWVYVGLVLLVLVGCGQSMDASTDGERMGTDEEEEVGTGVAVGTGTTDGEGIGTDTEEAEVVGTEDVKETEEVAGTAVGTEEVRGTEEEEGVVEILFTGVIVPARCVQAAIDERGSGDYIYEEVREIIQGVDLAVGTLNATISDYPPRTGCVSTYVLVGGAENADDLAEAGFDAMSVATNHIKNCGLSSCGDRAFVETMQNLERVGIQRVGAGMNHAEAMQPLVLEVNGVRFGIVSLGQIEPLAFAGESAAGIAVLNEENLRQAIAEARKVADVVIAMPHWGPEDSPKPNYLQTGLAQVAVEAGADLVVGNHTHVVQWVEEIAGVPVFYGLGNFVFDQTWSLDHQQGVMLIVRFKGKQLSGYELIPTHVDGDGTVHLAGEAEAQEILARMGVGEQGD